MKRAYRVTGQITSSDGAAAVGAQCALRSDALIAYKAGPSGCIGGQYSEGTYWLNVDNVAPDSYVASATAAGQDILSQPLRLDRDIESRYQARNGRGHN